MNIIAWFIFISYIIFYVGGLSGLFFFLTDNKNKFLREYLMMISFGVGVLGIILQLIFFR